MASRCWMRFHGVYAKQADNKLLKIYSFGLFLNNWMCQNLNLAPASFWANVSPPAMKKQKGHHWLVSFAHGFSTDGARHASCGLSLYAIHKKFRYWKPFCRVICPKAVTSVWSPKSMRLQSQGPLGNSALVTTSQDSIPPLVTPFIFQICQTDV